jgi:hypothetical protein
MLITEVIMPKSLMKWEERGFFQHQEEKLKSHSIDTILCDECSLSYSYKDYKTLFKGKKLGYFLFAYPDNPIKADILCHECLFKNIKKIADGKETKLMILSEDTEFECRFYPDETVEGADDTDFPFF